MYLRYGNYAHPIAEAGIVIRREAKRNDGGQFYAIAERWDVSGFLQAADQPSMSAALAAMENAYRIQGQGVGLFFDDGTPSFHGVVAGNTLGGPRVALVPTFPQGMGAEYSTFRSYQLTLEWELPIGDASNVMLSFHERLSFDGLGGPTFGYLPVTNGPPPKQLLTEFSTSRITQAGSAVGYLAYPPAMLPLFPEALHVERSKISRGEPKRMGPFGSPVWTEFPIEWSYEFELVGPDLSAIPNRWLN